MDAKIVAPDRILIIADVNPTIPPIICCNSFVHFKA